MKYSVYFIYLFHLLGVLSFAQVTTIDHFSVRQHALGNVKVAINSPRYAQYTNPAGLSVFLGENPFYRTRDRQPNHDLTFFQFSGSLQNSLFDTIDNLKTLRDSDSNSTKIEIIRSMIPLNQRVHTSLDIINWTRSQFAVGLYTSGHYSFDARRRSNPEIITTVYQDVVGSLAYSRLINNTAIGLTPKAVKRYYLYDKQSNGTPRTFAMTQDELIELTNDSASERLDDLTYYSPQGLLLDIGMLRPLSTQFGNGYWGLTVANLGPALRGSVTGNSETIRTKVPVTGTIGSSITLQSTSYWLRDTTLLADYDVISDVKDVKKRFHLGIERELFKRYSSVIARSIVVRGGLNQGFVVGGFGIKLVNFKSLSLIHLDYAYFTEELGDTIGMNTVSNHTIQFSLFF